MGNLLIRYATNWADEMDIEGLAVMTEDNWTEVQLDAKAFFDERDCTWEYGIGTNESIEYGNFGQWLSDFRIAKISTVETDILAELLNRVGIRNYAGKRFLVSNGFFPTPNKEEDCW